MKRYLSIAILVLSALLCAASGFMWVRSHSVADRVTICEGGRRIFSLYSVRGAFNFGAYDDSERSFDAFVGWWSFDRPPDDYDWWDDGWYDLRLWGVFEELPGDPWQYVADPPKLAPWRGIDLPGLLVRLGYDDGGVFRWAPSYGGTIAWWWLVILFGIPLWFTAIRRAMRLIRTRRRRSRGQCPQCGYDLRGLPGRCSECGTVQIPDNRVVSV